MSRSRVTLQKVFAILALIAILIGVIGTGWFLVSAPAVPVTVSNITTTDTTWEMMVTDDIVAPTAVVDSTDNS